MYTVVVSSQASKEIRKRGKNFKEKIAPIVTLLENDPKISGAEQLSGTLGSVYSYHFSYRGVSYRLAYVVDEERKTVSIILLAPRENFYEKLQRMFQ